MLLRPAWFSALSRARSLLSLPFLLPFPFVVLHNEPHIYSCPSLFFIVDVHECAETSVLVLEPEVRAYSVVSLRRSSLFCTLTSVRRYFCSFFPPAPFDLASLSLEHFFTLARCSPCSPNQPNGRWFAITQVTYRAYPTIERFYITRAPTITAYLFFTFNLCRPSRILVLCHAYHSFFSSPVFFFNLPNPRSHVWAYSLPF